MTRHILSPIDLEHGTAFCSVCGFMEALNVPDGFSGRPNHSENIGRSPAALAARWNEDHPDHLIQSNSGLQVSEGFRMA
jgi:hypothetical protein